MIPKLKALFTFKNIPPSLKEDDPYLHGQVYITFLGLYVGLVSMLVFTIVYGIVGNTALSILSFVDFILIVFSFFIYSKDPVKRKIVVPNLIILVQYITAYPIAMKTGGIVSSSLIWFTFFPSAMIMMNGIKNSIIWFFVSFFVIISFYLSPTMESAAYVVSQSSKVDWFIDVVMMTLLLTLLVGLADFFRKKTLKELNDSKTKINLMATELAGQNIELQNTIKKVKLLKGLLPICSNCKKIRDDKGYWSRIEAYIQKHSDATFSHGICPDCAKKLYPDIELYNDKKDT